MVKLRRFELVLASGIATALAHAGVTTYSSVAQPAAAWCAGVNQPRQFDFFYGSNIVARESYSDGGTCDGNTYYAGKVQDSYTDGSCAYVKLTEDYSNIWTQQTSCTTGAWVGYTYDDADGSFGFSVWTTYAGSSWRASSGA